MQTEKNRQTIDIAELFAAKDSRIRNIRKKQHRIYMEMELCGRLYAEEQGMKTGYGLGFDVTEEISEEWSEYDKMVAQTHLANYGQIIIDEEFGCPIDNEHDLYVISGLIRAFGEEELPLNSSKMN